MTIASTTNRVILTGNGIVVDIPFPYSVGTPETDLVVVATVIATGVQTTKAFTTHWTWAGSADASGHYPDGGTVTALVAPPSTETWTVYRDPPAEQGLDLVANDDLPAEATEFQFDYLTMLIQRVKDQINRTLQQPEGDAATISRLPAKIARASMFLAFDANGDPIAAAGTTSDFQPVSSFINTLLDDADAATARATLNAHNNSMLEGKLLGRTTVGTGAIEEIQPDGSMVLASGLLGVAAASTALAGKIELATQAEVDSGTALRAVTTDLNRISLGAETPIGSTGTDITFPAGVRRIDIHVLGMSLSGTDDILLQIGDSGGLETTGYLSSSAAIAAAGVTVASSTAGFIVKSGVAANIFSGVITLKRFGTVDNDWICSYSLKSSATVLCMGGGQCIALSTALTTVRLTRTGSDTFDLGEISVTYER